MFFPATLDLDNKKYLVVPKDEYQAAIARAAGVKLPALPKADKKGRTSASAFASASMARSIIVDRLALGWTQQDLANATGLAVETISRIETGKHRPQAGTVSKIDRALANAEH
ncbi:MAG: helix-turn-helix transcriptional regulator [Algisphaera sp.]